VEEANDPADPTDPTDPKYKFCFLGYKYNKKKVLSFVFSRDDGSTKVNQTRPYLARFNDGYNNLVTREVDRPSIICDYFRDNSSVVDNLAIPSYGK
jgi:hypothetical protein